MDIAACRYVFTGLECRDVSMLASEHRLSKFLVDGPGCIALIDSANVRADFTLGVWIRVRKFKWFFEISEWCPWSALTEHEVRQRSCGRYTDAFIFARGLKFIEGKKRTLVSGGNDLLDSFFRASIPAAGWTSVWVA